MLSLIAQQLQFGDALVDQNKRPFQFYQPGVNKDVAGAATQVELFLSNIIGFLTLIAGLAFMLYFVFGAIGWTLAGGDQGKIDKSKQQMTNGAIGLIIVILAYGIIGIVGGVVGLNILNPAKVIQQLNPAGTNPGGGTAVPAPPGGNVLQQP